MGTNPAPCLQRWRAARWGLAARQQAAVAGVRRHEARGGTRLWRWPSIGGANDGNPSSDARKAPRAPSTGSSAPMAKAVSLSGERQHFRRTPAAQPNRDTRSTAPRAKRAPRLPPDR
jgi:hypothetical protein